MLTRSRRWILVACALLSQATLRAADVRLISSDVNGVVFEYRPLFSEPTAVEYRGKTFLVLTVDGARDKEDLRTGSPRLQIRSVLLAFPGLSGHSAEVVAADYEDIPDVNLAPLPRIEGDFDRLKKKYETEDLDYSVGDYLPTLAKLVDIGIVRGYCLGEVCVAPFQYNPAARSLRKFTRIVVEVKFGSADFMPHAGPEEPLMRELPLNYAAARGWRLKDPSAVAPAFRSSVFATGPWYRFSITEPGMYKLTGAALTAAGIPATVNPGDIRIHSNGGTEPPAEVLAAYPDDVQELAVYVNDQGTVGQLDPTDYIVFYGQGPRGWKYSPASRSVSHYVNLYANEATYWLTYGSTPSKRMQQLSPPLPSPDFTPTRVVGKVFREDERVNPQNSGRQWLGQSFNPGDAVTYRFPLPGFDSTQRMTYRYRFGARNTTSSSTFEVTEHGSLLSSTYVERTGGDYQDIYVVMKDVSVSPPVNNFTEEESRLGFRYTAGTVGMGYIDWLEILYPRRLEADNNAFSFHSHDTTAVTSYTIGGFTGTDIVGFDVTRLDSVLFIPNSSTASGQFGFQVSLTAGDVPEYYVLGPGGFRTPPALQSFTNQDLHGDTTSVDFVIVTHKDFLSAAQRLKAHRQRSGPDRLLTKVVDVDLIYNEFSGGQPSQVGIRNYLRYLYYTCARPPAYVLLLGDGDLDYRRISSTGPNWIPVWETMESFAQIPLNSFATEDSIAMVTGSAAINMAIGRLPVRSLAQANDVISKIIEYETTSATDPWKLRVTLVADDGLTSEGNDFTLHTSQAESLSNLVPTFFEKQKVYIAEYPTVVTSLGRRKPVVNDVIVQKINAGTLVLNYTGHGNPRVWTHEQVFVRETDFPRMANSPKYFLLVAATCNYSQFDHPNDQSGGEQIVVRSSAGAIGSLSATRAVFAGDNFSLNTTFYQRLFVLESDGRIRPIRLGDAFFQTKLTHYGGLYQNDRKFVLLGDPSLRIAFPRRFATVDSINGQPSDSVVQIQALSRVSVAAQVRDTASLQSSPFTGNALVTVYDSDRKVRIYKPEESFNYEYTASGGAIFRGQSRIVNGLFGSTFVVPADISYQNQRGRISVYFYNSETDGAGVTTSIRVGGTDASASSDSVGPRIDVFLGGRGFRPGDLVPENPLLLVDLYDEHGINTSGAGLGHQIEAWLDDNTEGISLSEYYRSKADSYQEGSVEYTLTGLAPGRHRLRLRAWDTYNNSSVAESNFDVLVKVGLQITNLFNYPNPFSTTTDFTFEHNDLSAVDVEVKIYTVAGRHVRTVREFGQSNQFVKIPWDGRDEDGDELANGVYLYKVLVRTQDGRFTSEALGKLTKVR